MKALERRKPFSFRLSYPPAPSGWLDSRPWLICPSCPFQASFHSPPFYFYIENGRNSPTKSNEYAPVSGLLRLTRLFLFPPLPQQRASLLTRFRTTSIRIEYLLTSKDCMIYDSMEGPPSPHFELDKKPKGLSSHLLCSQDPHSLTRRAQRQSNRLILPHPTIKQRARSSPCGATSQQRIGLRI